MNAVLKESKQISSGALQRGFESQAVNRNVKVLSSNCDILPGSSKCCQKLWMTPVVYEGRSDGKRKGMDV